MKYMSNAFKLHYGPLDPMIVSTFAQGFRLRLPSSYKNFLSEINGGNPIKDYFYLKDGSNSSILSGLFGLCDNKNYNLIRYYIGYVGYRIPSNTIPIAADALGNLILLSVKGPDYGKVYFWDHELEAEDGQEPDYSNLTLIADSFEEFISNLKSEEEVEALERNT